MDLFAKLPPAWQAALRTEVLKLAEIGHYLEQNPDFNPKIEFIFNALGKQPADFRVVIVGQDPYPNPEHAMGIAFSVPNKIKNLPPTLKNISNELKNDLGLELPNDLTHWTSQGILLLNRILTCKNGQSLSHQKIGWQAITDQIIKEVVAVNPDCVAILWGNTAAEVETFFNPKQIIRSAHPSPLSAHRGFFGSKPFSRANQLLVNSGQQPIDWV